MEHDIEGPMVVRCTIASSGQVRDCQIMQGLPYMDSAVIEALEERRYTPVTLDGAPVDVRYTFRLRFRLPHEQQ